MKRYEILRFPTKYGTPKYADSYLGALLIAIGRWLASGELGEVRVIDTKTGDHVIVW